MAGSLYGFFFKSVVNSMLLGSVLFPDIKQRISEMQDDKLYSWDEYTAIVQRIAEKMSPATLRKCGMNLMRSSKEFYQKNGYRTMDDMMSKFDKGFKSSVVGAPPQDGVEVMRFEPGKVKLRFGAIQPKALSEGYILGAAEIFDANIESMVCTDVEFGGYKFHVFEVSWRDA
jgi:hypothetical protein